MTAKEQIVEDMAFSITADIRQGIKPASMAAGRRWLRTAIVWARRNNLARLENKIMGYLDSAWPVKTYLPVCRTMPTLPALKAA